MRKKGIITAAARSHKVVLSDTEFHCEDRAHKCHHILHCQLWVLSRICYCFPNALYLAKVSRLLVITRDSAFIYKKQNENNSQKKAVFVDLKFEICSVCPKPEGKWKQQKCIFFLCFWYSYSLRGCNSFGGLSQAFCSCGGTSLALPAWSQLDGANPDFCATEAAPRDTSRSCTSLMAELRRESRS